MVVASTQSARNRSAASLSHDILARGAQVTGYTMSKLQVMVTGYGKKKSRQQGSSKRQLWRWKRSSRICIAAGARHSLTPLSGSYPLLRPTGRAQLPLPANVWRQVCQTSFTVRWFAGSAQQAERHLAAGATLPRRRGCGSLFQWQ